MEDKEWEYKPQQSFFASPDTYHIAYERAKSLCLKSGLTVHDIVNLSPKFWDFHLDLTLTRDISALMIAQIHLNLCVGSIGAHVAATSRTDLDTLLEDLMSFRTCASFLLTEFGHGLDVKNMETTATLLPDGSYDIHTPSPAAAKAMPPTTPLARCPRVAVVLAKLVVPQPDGSVDHRGFKLFLVPLASAHKMHPGVTAWMLPVRPGTTPLDHSLTSFRHVHLPPSALLGSPERATGDAGLDLHRQLWRVSVGAIALSLGNIACLRVASYITGVYSKHRLVEKAGGKGKLVPIISFSTQYRPILQALVAAEVLGAYARWTTDLFSNDRNLDILVRRGLAVVFKATVVHMFRVMPELADRCGWRGYYPHNQLADLYLSYSANAVAEGDVHVLSLRLAVELLSGRYTLPAAQDPNTLLARHESGLFSRLQGVASDSSSFHGDSFNARGLPRCRQLIVAIGHRMAFEAAKSATISAVSADVLGAFEAACVNEDPAWYVENLSYTQDQAQDMETAAYERLRPRLDELLERTGARGYVTSPLVANEGEWAETVCNLPCFSTAGLEKENATMAKM
ncbi:hypothetical protein V2A60_000357 [Cordyceps javanica]|uniref:Acyloxidase n=1 Tax=Cordyceps javanica TaxID=43265 RepID=A0A545V5I6_9HYPO|nr:acyloxidase [Cordyceps javanica]TQW08242.1 acyloxidase [Cordyceps javanica]